MLGAVNTSNHMAIFSNVKSYPLQKCGRVAIIDCGAETLTADQIFFLVDQHCNSSVLNSASSHAVEHYVLLGPLEEAGKFLSSISDAELLCFVSTYPSLLTFPADMEVDQSTHFVVTRQLLQDSLLRHWLVQLILPSVIKWVLALSGDLHKHPTTDNASSFRMTCLPPDASFVALAVIGQLHVKQTGDMGGSDEMEEEELSLP
ncbi:origin recognition complex subunit 3 [Echinococcus multilocularis]|uniref:Origin recognition complex subunit 3 n=1 Tax=Echinococcus multilocularis TaxID=6211 RepID=A0A0S4MJA4_ECHMU|nr:origin recognition complex subunit 3 [Echinococcus multilocularis]